MGTSMNMTVRTSLMSESLSMLPGQFHEHTADMQLIGMKVSHENKHKYDSPTSLMSEPLSHDTPPSAEKALFVCN